MRKPANKVWAGVKKQHRMTLELPPEAVERLDRLQDLLKATSRAETIRRALAVADLVASATIQDGSAVVLRRENGEEETLRMVF